MSTGDKPFGLQRHGVQIHGNQALLAAVGEGQRRALHGRQLGADKIIAEIEKLPAR